MKTHQEIHNMIDSFYVAGETAFTAADILHALNDRVELLCKAQQVTVHGCEELTKVGGDLEKRLEEFEQQHKRLALLQECHSKRLEEIHPTIP